MEHIEYKDIIQKKFIGTGAFSSVYGAEYNNEDYALKLFDFPDDIFKYGFEEKLDYLDRCKLVHSEVPKYILTLDGKRLGYLVKLLSLGAIIDVPDYIERFKILKKVKEGIVELHDEGIVHGDIHGGNIIGDNNGFYLTDFDNCNISKLGFSHFDPELASTPAVDFYKRNGLIKNLDIFMFNILTFELLYERPHKQRLDYNVNLSYQHFRFSVSGGDFGIFDKKKSKKVCSNTRMFNADEYLIDTIDSCDVEKIM